MVHSTGDQGSNKFGNDEIDSDTEAFPLSPAQLGMWFAQHLDPEVPISIAQYVDLRGELDVELLREASDCRCARDRFRVPADHRA